DLAEAYRGTKKTVTLSRAEVCSACAGSGSKPGTRPRPCRQCHGQRVVTQTIRSFLNIRHTVVCPACAGRGIEILDPCPACRGAGRAEARRSKEVEVPAGVYTGLSLRLTGEGD